MVVFKKNPSFNRFNCEKIHFKIVEQVSTFLILFYREPESKQVLKPLGRAWQKWQRVGWLTSGCTNVNKNNFFGPLLHIAHWTKNKEDTNSIDLKIENESMISDDSIEIQVFTVPRQIQHFFEQIYIFFLFLLRIVAFNKALSIKPPTQSIITGISPLLKKFPRKFCLIHIFSYLFLETGLNDL